MMMMPPTMPMMSNDYKNDKYRTVPCKYFHGYIIFIMLDHKDVKEERIVLSFMIKCMLVDQHRK